MRGSRLSRRVAPRSSVLRRAGNFLLAEQSVGNSGNRFADRRANELAGTVAFRMALVCSRVRLRPIVTAYRLIDRTPQMDKRFLAMTLVAASLPARIFEAPTPAFWRDGLNQTIFHPSIDHLQDPE